MYRRLPPPRSSTSGVPARLIAQHVIAAFVIGWFAKWNAGWIGELKGGKAAGRDPGNFIWKGISPRQRRWAEPVIKFMGNPFAFPASAIFSARHGISWKRWDRVVGHYLLQPTNKELNEGTYRGTSKKLGIGPDLIIYGLGPFATVDKRRYRPTTGALAAVFVQSLLPDPQTISWPLRSACGPAPVILRWNHQEVARGTADSTPAPLVARVEPKVGVNVLELEVPFGCVVEVDNIEIKILKSP